jgi:DNA-binding transcriptional LysR family regulator
MCRLVEVGFGIALLPEGVLTAHVSAGTLRVVNLKDTWSRRQLVLVVRDLDTLPLTTRMLIDHLRAAAAA